MSGHLRDGHFTKLCSLIEQHTGIQLPSSKRAMLEGRLQRRLRATGFATLAEYGDELFERGLLDKEFEILVDCATTNKTDFFREPDHFDFLRDRAVPSLLASPETRSPLLKVWSAACSTGAEAYTVAMVLAGLPNLRFSILGTDICTSVLAQARTGIYAGALIDPVPAALRRRFVMESADPARDEVRIVPELRARCRYDQLNLMDADYPYDRDIDIIFCRNVLIYFARPMQQAVIKRLSSHLRPGGYLILGHAESFAPEASSSLAQVSPSIYHRTIVRAHSRKAA